MLANDADPDGGALSAVLVTGPGHGSLSLAADGSFVYTPVAGYVGTDTFTYAPAGGAGAGAPVTVTLAVTNLAPVAIADAVSLTSSAPLAIDVLANDRDGDADSLAVTGVTQGAHGSVTFTTAGVTYIPVAGFTGTDTFTYTAEDGFGGVATGRVTVTTVQVGAGVWAYGEATYSGGTAALGVAGRAESDTAQPAGFHGVSVALPAADSYTVTFQYDLSTWDSYSPESWGSTGYYDSFSFSRTDAPYPLLPPGGDPLDPARYPFVWGGQTWGDGLETTTGSVTLTLPGNLGGSNWVNVVLDTFTQTDADPRYPSWGSVSLSFAPAITSGGGATAAVGVAENTTAVTTVSAFDPDAGTTLTYSIAGGADAAKFAINPTTGALAFVSAPDFENPTDAGADNVYDVVVRVTDGVFTDTQALAVTVTDSAAGTIQFAAGTATAAEGAGAVVLTVTRTGGTEATSVTFATASGTATAASDFTAVSGTLTWAAGDTAPKTITVPIIDNGSGETAETFTVALSAPTGGATLGTASAAVTITDPVLAVTSVAATPSGLVLTFNRGVGTGDLNLYDSASSLGAADLTVTGATTGTQRGSLLVLAPNVLTFVRTGGPLPVDTYTVALTSSSTGFKDLGGTLLDGDGNGTVGGNYSGAVTVASSSAVVVGLPDFARGAGQAVNVPGNGTGLSLTVSDVGGVTSVQVDVLFDASLLSITGGTAAIAGSMVSVTAIAGGVRVSVTGIPAGTTGTNATVANLTASVPTTAPYANKQVLDLTNAQVNGGTAAVADDAVQVAAYMGDLDGNQAFNSADNILLQRVQLGTATGFLAYQLADPLLLADFNRDGSINSADGILLSRKIVGIAVPLIPDIPAGVTPAAQTGPDPRLYFANASAARGQTATVALRLNVVEPGGVSGVTSLDVAARFDPSRFVVSNVRFAPDSPFAGWQILVSVDNAAGTIRITLYSPTEPGLSLEEGYDADLLLFDFAVRSDAAAGASSLNLARRVGDTWTNINGFALPLLPGPTDADNDAGVDGVLTVLP
ncbi:MAG: cadherin-like domain-containing protein [Gemmataceae bacterium]|nr:cadherin-like domain-containing protein [Gemmataceae bacterium]